MSDVRREIDRLDQALVDMLTERQFYIREAGRIKGDRNIVRDPARIEDVVTKVKAHAAKTGLDPVLAETVWRELIEQSIRLEFGWWDDSHSKT